MSDLTSSAETPSSKGLDREQRRVLGASLVGTTLEWYDFFIYANAAALIFAAQYFGPLGQDNPELAQLLSFASVGISFLFRPFGAALAGWLGDRFGRKVVLFITLALMGGATTLMGLLPTYALIGVWAPVLLVLLRIIQGISAGGEWGGAALLAVEHAPVRRRGFFGAYPQIGVPLGMLLASGVLAGLALTLTDEQFESWGWRVPFLISFLLIIIGFWIRMRVSESPVFQEIREKAVHATTPVRQLFREDSPTVFKAALALIGNNAAGYMITGGFILGYASTTLGLPYDTVLILISIAAAAWIFTTLSGAVISDRIGRRPTLFIGYAIQIVWVIPMFLLIETESMWMILIAVLVFSIPIGLCYGPQSAMYSEMFPAQIRLSGVSISYAIHAILGGAFAPTISQWLLNQTGWIGSVGVYLIFMAIISAVVVWRIREPRGTPLFPQEGLPLSRGFAGRG